MDFANLRIELFYDPEAGNWNFMVPALNITGGGCKTREESERDALSAIKFALEGETGADMSPHVEVVEAQVELTIPRSTPRKTATA